MRGKCTHPHGAALFLCDLHLKPAWRVPVRLVLMNKSFSLHCCTQEPWHILKRRGWRDWGGDRCPQHLQDSCSGRTRRHVFEGIRFNNPTCGLGKIQSSSLSVWKYTERHHSRLHIITSFTPPHLHDSPHLVLI